MRAWNNMIKKGNKNTNMSRGIGKMVKFQKSVLQKMFMKIFQQVFETEDFRSYKENNFTTMFDPFTIFFQETKIEPKQKTEKFESVQPSTPSDSIVINYLSLQNRYKKYVFC